MKLRGHVKLVYANTNSSIMGDIPKNCPYANPMTEVAQLSEVRSSELFAREWPRNMQRDMNNSHQTGFKPNCRVIY